MKFLGSLGIIIDWYALQYVQGFIEEKKNNT